MTKFLFHVVIFALGAGAGIWWSANNPDVATNIADREQQEAARLQAAVSQAKIDLLEKFLASSTDSKPNAPDSGYERMLSDEQKKLDDAKQQIGKSGN